MKSPMRNRLRAAWAVLRGRPVIYGCTFKDGRIVSKGALEMDNAMSRYRAEIGGPFEKIAEAGRVTRAVWVDALRDAEEAAESRAASRR